MKFLFTVAILCLFVFAGCDFIAHLIDNSQKTAENAVNLAQEEVEGVMKDVAGGVAGFFGKLINGAVSDTVGGIDLTDPSSIIGAEEKIAEQLGKNGFSMIGADNMPDTTFNADLLVGDGEAFDESALVVATSRLNMLAAAASEDFSTVDANVFFNDLSLDESDGAKIDTNRKPIDISLNQDGTLKSLSTGGEAITYTSGDNNYSMKFDELLYNPETESVYGDMYLDGVKFTIPK